MEKHSFHKYFLALYYYYFFLGGGGGKNKTFFLYFLMSFQQISEKNLPTQLNNYESDVSQHFFKDDLNPNG